MRRGSLLKEIDDLNRWHSALNQDLEKLAADRQAARLQVEEQKSEAARLEKNLAEIRKKFCQRLKIRYCQPSGKWIDYLDSTADLTENLNSLVYGRRVLEADKKLQNSYLSLLAEINNHHLELKKRHQFLAHLEQQQADKMATLEENIAIKMSCCIKSSIRLRSMKSWLLNLKRLPPS